MEPIKMATDNFAEFIITDECSSAGTCEMVWEIQIVNDIQICGHAEPLWFAESDVWD